MDIKKLIAKKQNKISKVKAGYPNEREGRDGDLQIRTIASKGIFLFFKFGNTWYGTRLEPALKIKNPRDDNKLIVQPGNVGKVEGEICRSGKDVIVNIDSNNQISLGETSSKLIRNVDNGNPFFQIGSSDTECLKIIANYDSGGRGIDKVQYVTLTASGTADKGKHEFYVDGTSGGDLKLTIDDDGLIAYDPITASEIQTSSGTITLDAATDVVLDANSGIYKFLLAGDADDLCTLTVGANGATTIATADSDASGGSAAGDLTLAPDGDLIVTPETGLINFTDGASNIIEIDVGTPSFSLIDDDDTDGARDYFKIAITGNGETVMSTNDDSTALAHLNIEPDGHTEFDGCAVGFDLVAPTYNASDTNVLFTTGNKQSATFGSGNITDLNLVFPATSGNFTLLLKQDGTGSRTVTNYKVWYLVDSSAASGSATVKFAGGSNPTLTTTGNKLDILSFFWDADNQIAYGAVIHNF